MVIGVFPIGKIAVLGIKQITTPLSQGFKLIAKNNLLFKNYICVPAGQLLNSMEARCKMQMLGLPQPKRIPRLPEKTATDMGANILSELFVILLGLSLIFCEVSRQAIKDQKKNDNLKIIEERLKSEISELIHQLDWQEKQIQIMHHQLTEYNGIVHHKTQ